MKKLNHIKFILPALLLAACSGGGSKNPVADLDKMRQDAKADAERGPELPRETVQKEIIEKYNETTIENTIIKEEATMNESYVHVDYANKNNVLMFYEGTTTSTKIQLRVMIPGVKMKLTLVGAPAGATLTEVSSSNEPNTYEFKWTPSLYTIAPHELSPKSMSVTLVPEFDSKNMPDDETRKKIESQPLERKLHFFVSRTEERPSELSLQGLSTKATVDEGQIIPFSVTARIPGIDDKSPIKPTLAVTNDDITQIAGTQHREMPGGYYVMPDPSRAAVEYLGDFKWKFNQVFDTKNNSVQAQLAKDGSVIPNADTTHTRFRLRVYSELRNTNATIVQVAIKRLPVNTAQPKGAK